MNQNNSAGCEFHQQQIASYLYGELSEDEKQLVESHFTNCEECQTLLQETRQVLADVEEAAQSDPIMLPEGYLFQRLSRSGKLEAITLKRARRRLALQVGTMAASFILGILTATVWFTAYRSAESPTPSSSDLATTGLRMGKHPDEGLMQIYTSPSLGRGKVLSALEELERQGISTEEMRMALSPYLVGMFLMVPNGDGKEQAAKPRTEKKSPGRDRVMFDARLKFAYRNRLVARDAC